MGTNYFVNFKGKDYCEHCKRGIIEIHVGKQSMGWRFLFQTYETDDLKIRSMKDWIEFIEEKNLQIEDNYQRPITMRDFIIMVKESMKGLSHLKYHGAGITGSVEIFNLLNKNYFDDQEGYEFCVDEFS